MTDADELVEGLIAGEQRAIARAITVIENREPAYRELVSALFSNPGDADVIGVTGSPGVGKSTLVDALVRAYRERGQTVGVVAIDPASPFSGGAILGDRVRMGGLAGDDGVFVRSMSARGDAGGLAAATMDAVRALSAAGVDVVVVETVGAGQNEVEVVTTADTVIVATQPTSGDDVQTMKAGLLEIADIYVVNKADLDGVDRVVHDLKAMVQEGDRLGSHRIGPDAPDVEWTPPVVETIATDGTGIPDLLDAIDDHLAFLEDEGLRERKARVRLVREIRTHLAAAVEDRVEGAIEAAGGIDGLVDRVLAGEADPYGLASELLDGDPRAEPDETAAAVEDR